MGIPFLTSLHNRLFKNIPHVGFVWQFIICCICVFVYLCICIFVFARLTHVNIIFDTSEQSSFQEYTTCWVFLALCNMLHLCICVFVFVYLSMRHLIISVLISLDQELSENICFVWFKTSYIGDVTDAGQRQGKIVLLKYLGPNKNNFGFFFVLHRAVYNGDLAGGISRKQFLAISFDWSDLRTEGQRL